MEQYAATALFKKSWDKVLEWNDLGHVVCRRPNQISPTNCLDRHGQTAAQKKKPKRLIWESEPGEISKSYYARPSPRSPEIRQRPKGLGVKEE